MRAPQRLASRLRKTGGEHGFPGDPKWGLQEERTLEKYRECAKYRLTDERVAAVEHDLLNMESVPNMARVMDALTDVPAKVARVMPA